MNSRPQTQPIPARQPDTTDDPGRRRFLARGTAAVLAAGGLGACAARPPPPPPVAARGPETALARLLGGRAELLVGGEALDTAALRRFYALRRFEPVWANRQSQAEDLAALVLRAGDHGLDPEMFHGGLLRRPETIAPLRRDLVLTDAFLAYAGALAHGAVPADKRMNAEAMAPDPVDLAAVLDGAIDGADPVGLLESLAPQTPTYLGLRLAMRGGGPRSHRARNIIPRQRTAALAAQAAAQRQRSIEANLERERWLPRALPADRVWVNVPDQQLVLYRNHRPAFTTSVVVGDNAERNQTPEFHALIEAIFFNPPWVIPRDIVEAEILPRLQREPDYLARNNMVLRANGEIEQSAGPQAGLGFLLFDMPNRFDVFLHDTPDRFLFSRSNRRISRGCIRVQNPRELATLLMDQPMEEIDRQIAAGETTRANLPVKVPVFITYRTAFVDLEGAMQFRADFYERDPGVWRRLRRQAQA